MFQHFLEETGELYHFTPNNWSNFMKSWVNQSDKYYVQIFFLITGYTNKVILNKYIFI